MIKAEYTAEVLLILDLLAREYDRRNMRKYDALVLRLADTITAGNTITHLSAAAKIMRRADELADRHLVIPLEGDPRVISTMPFKRSIRTLVTDEPRVLVQGIDSIAQVYREGGQFAISAASVEVGASQAAVSAALNVTNRVRLLLVRDGEGAAAAVQQVLGSTQAYAQTIVRTNMNTAATNGTTAFIRA